MAVYCISYDLKSDNYSVLIESIKAYGLWWHQSESTWFIETIHGSKQILENLNRHLFLGDKILVIQVQKKLVGSRSYRGRVSVVKKSKFLNYEFTRYIKRSNNKYFNNSIRWCYNIVNMVL